MTRSLLRQPGQWPWLIRGLHGLTPECIYSGCGEGVGASAVAHGAVAAVSGRAGHGCRGSRAAAASAGSTEFLPGELRPRQVPGGVQPALGRAVGNGELAGTQWDRKTTSLLYWQLVALFLELEALMNKYFLLRSINTWEKGKKQSIDLQMCKNQKEKHSQEEKFSLPIMLR